MKDRIRSPYVALAAVAASLIACTGAAGTDAALEHAVDASATQDRIIFDAPRCVDGTIAACFCTDGTPGRQRCASDGTFGDCACGDASFDAGPSSDAADAERDDEHDEGSCVPRTCASIAATCGIVATGCGATVDCGPCDPIFRRIDGLDVRHVAFDSRRHVLYATLGDRAEHDANTVATFDPPTGNIVATLPIGTAPGPLATSGDGTELYVGVGGASLVTVDLASHAIVHSAMLLGPASAIVALNGARRVLVSAGSSLVVFDGGSVTASAYVRSEDAPAGLAATPDDFAYAGSDPNRAQRQLAFAIAPGRIDTRLFPGASDIRVDPRPTVIGDRLLRGDGFVQSLADRFLPATIHRLDRVGSVTADAELNRIYVLGAGGTMFGEPVSWSVYDARTYELIADIAVGSDLFFVRELVRIGERTFAARIDTSAGAGTLLIITSPIP